MLLGRVQFIEAKSQTFQGIGDRVVKMRVSDNTPGATEAKRLLDQANDSSAKRRETIASGSGASGSGGQAPEPAGATAVSKENTNSAGSEQMPVINPRRIIRHTPHKHTCMHASSFPLKCTITHTHTHKQTPTHAHTQTDLHNRKTKKVGPGCGFGFGEGVSAPRPQEGVCEDVWREIRKAESEGKGKRARPVSHGLPITSLERYGTQSPCRLLQDRGSAVTLWGALTTGQDCSRFPPHQNIHYIEYINHQQTATLIRCLAAYASNQTQWSRSPHISNNSQTVRDPLALKCVGELSLTHYNHIHIYIYIYQKIICICIYRERYEIIYIYI